MFDILRPRNESAIHSGDVVETVRQQLSRRAHRPDSRLAVHDDRCTRIQRGQLAFQFVHRATGKVYSLVGAQPVDVFTRWIDDLLAGKEPPKERQVEPAPAPRFDVPFWATPDGLAPDPKRPGFTAAGDR